MKKVINKVRIGMAQINPTVGDLPDNTSKVIEYIKKAENAKVDILSFPELAISGYPPEDLLLKRDFVDCNTKCLNKIVEFTKNKLYPVVVLGFVEIDKKQGNKLYNSAAIIQNGKVASIYQKTLLPNYSVFDEKRYFSSGRNAKVFNIGDLVFAVNICEDIWGEGEMSELLSSYSGSKLLININASPFHRKKWQERENILKKRATQSSSFITYTNMVGGQDELVFDGHSMIVNPHGDVVVRGKAFEEDFIVWDMPVEKTLPQETVIQVHGTRLESSRETDKPTIQHSTQEPPQSEEEEIYEALLLGVRDYCRKNRFSHVLIGLSGGIDSAITLSAAVDALGVDKVQPVLMPSRFTAKESIEDAEETARNMGTSLITIPIHDTFESYLNMLNPVFQNLPWSITEENLQARVRGNILMALSNKWGHLVLTTGNKSENSVGYATLYGDMAGGFGVIKDLLKTYVYSVSEYINSQKKTAWIPKNVIEKEPSAELRENQKDSDSLPEYSILDPILELYVENDMPVDEIISRGFDRETVLRIAKMVDSTEYKRRQAAIGIRITPKAFGRDRRLPITNRFLFS